MHEEMKSLHKNNTYELMELPKGKRALKNKWTLKRNPEPNISQPRYKTRLVVKGFSQKKDIDFEEIFSPMVKMSSIRVVLGLAANMNLEIEQLDVKIVFLHGDLEEEIYIWSNQKGLQSKARTLSVSIEEELVWSQAGIKTVVQEVWFFHGWAWVW